ncbi:hypothetical protein J3R30DRAFT_3278865 [Lentinula aciculospora]|uniref:Uncharacterized protein n=1 Tax=Lentinula aciculospora TaxID=153920 RepID=A0A9W9DY72_9AGAR|nr:hypothetical protein J3R30DRAFT_3278865 [Lentinula aciculospora]
MSYSTQVILNPIHLFFERYSEFRYNPSRETMAQFWEMCDCYHWDKEDDERTEALAGIRDAIAQQFNAFYGDDADSLEGWHSLFRALQIQDVPDTVKGCKDLIETIHVNICDLVDHKEDVPLKHPSEDALAEYSRSSGKIYPRENAYAGGLLRFLLRQIYGKYRGRRRKGGQGEGGGQSRGGSRRRRRRHD